MSDQEGRKARARAAYDMRPHYHPTAEAAGRTAQLETPAFAVRRSRSGQTVALVQTAPITRNRSQTGRGQKRTNNGTTIDLAT